MAPIFIWIIVAVSAWLIAILIPPAFAFLSIEFEKVWLSAVSLVILLICKITLGVCIFGIIWCLIVMIFNI